MNPIQKIYLGEVMECFKAQNVKPGKLEDKDLEHLPDLVKKYIHYTGALCQEKVYNLRMVFSGKMKMNRKQGWIKIHSDQHNFFLNPARIFYIKSRMFGLPIVGRDLYLKGMGHMLIKAAGIFKIADATGPEMDQSALVTLFNDMCLMAPATLIDERISWESLDEKSVKGIFTDRDKSATASLFFEPDGRLRTFVTEDRFYSTSGKTYKKVRWSTPVSDYIEVNGLKIPTVGNAIWHMDACDFHYARFNLVDLAYNQNSI